MFLHTLVYKHPNYKYGVEKIVFRTLESKLALFFQRDKEERDESKIKTQNIQE